ncbi:putative vacuolar protein sorting-associated protein [Thalictrum thalictroides]|uniref:Putative vacuolar protein sorting-associated protein n=1 Tax=Thalictrum thalictroides TaxID=46969 RepID=A0A7J6XBA9_THATH|nr:putative vacuolar protein sorting-associated protein [Thalictrum thalictroides]
MGYVLSTYFAMPLTQAWDAGKEGRRVLLKNVELNLEAFDKLQLPFSLNEGRVGILSIKVGHPIIISLENVLICACERDDHEWSSDSVERREYAGKKAKLHAAEVAKFTRRVSGECRFTIQDCALWLS